LNFPSFIINYDAGTKQYSCYHGQDELQETVRQLVIQQYYPDFYCDYFKNYYSNAKHDWQGSAQTAKIDAIKIEELKQKHGKSLLSAHYNKIKTVPLLQSPTVIIDGRYIINDINQYFKDENIKLSGSCGN